MKRIAIFLFLFFFAGSLHAQTIAVYKTFGGLRFERDSVPISAKQVYTILEDVPEARAVFAQARVNSTIASVLGFAGGILIGFPLGSALVGADPEWGLALAGAALIGISIPFNKAFDRHSADAIDLYNNKKSARQKARGFHTFRKPSCGRYGES